MGRQRAVNKQFNFVVAQVLDPIWQLEEQERKDERMSGWRVQGSVGGRSLAKRLVEHRGEAIGQAGRRRRLKERGNLPRWNKGEREDEGEE